MTSQVAIFNMNGVAVASDTVGVQNSDRGKKTTNNSEKIYPLGDSHLVVALHAGSSAINGLSHQFHFNRWVETLSKPLDSLKDYVDNYLDWSSKNRLHSIESENSQIFWTIKDHFKELIRRTQSDYENSEEPQDYSEYIFSRLQFHAEVGLKYLKTLPKLEGITLEKAKNLISERQYSIQDIFVSASNEFWVLNDHPKIPSKIMRILSQSAPLMLIGAQDLPWDSQLAFVGFGAKDHFPGSLTINCNGILDNHIIHTREEATFVGPDQRSYIEKYAQYDAINSFIRGFNDDILGGVLYAIKGLSFDKLEGKIDFDILNQIASITFDYITEYSQRTYVDPMLTQIANMNTYSLSELARTLVGLQATSSEAKDGPVSVGGLIEVLTIDRARGIQWRSRLP